MAAAVEGGREVDERRAAKGAIIVAVPMKGGGEAHKSRAAEGNIVVAVAEPVED